MFKNNILNAFVSQSFPNKCQTLNTILEECNPKELCSSFEIIVNCIFSSTTKINYYLSDTSTSYPSHHNIEQRINWPLKLVNRSQYGLEYDCIFNFLNSNSLFWYSMFRLDHMGVTFCIECQSLPAHLKYRIENGLSSLSAKSDAFNVLNLNAIEFYLLHFLLLLYDNSTNSRRLYNEQYGNIELDSVYADLLADYLNYFLPINEREVAFPSFVDLNQTKQDLLSSSPIPTHKSHTSLLRRVVQKSLTEDNLTMLNEPDTVGDMKKIDLFLRLFIEILVNSFTDAHEQESLAPGLLKKQYTGYNSHMDSSILSLNETASNKGLLSSSAADFRKNLSFTSPSPVRLNDPKQYLANIETIFALSMTLKHFHTFTNAFPLNMQLQSNQEWSQLNESLSFTNYRKPVKNICIHKSPIDELRMVLFKAYLRKPFYKFFQFHLEHWPLTPSIKWVIESWLTYIQPWKFIQVNSQIKTFNLTSEFVKENLLVYTDIYQLIIKRYCIFDLTNEDNLIILHRILSLFYSQAQIINKYDNIFSNVQNQLTQMTKQECEINLRQNAEFRNVVNHLNEFNKPIYAYKPLNGLDNLRLVTNFYETLLNAKETISVHLRLKTKPQASYMSSVFKFFFESEQDKQFGNLNVEDLHRIINHIDECENLIKGFYNSHSLQFEVFGSKEGSFSSDPCSAQPTKSMAGNTAESTVASIMSPAPKNSRASPECEMAMNGSLKLSPRGRFQIINRLCNPVISSYYNPDTSPIGEFENRFLIFALQKLSNFLNEKYYELFEHVYSRDDLFGKIGRKCLYGPNDFSNKLNANLSGSTLEQNRQIYLRNEKLNAELNNPNFFRVRLSLRALANYRFLLYFSLMCLFVKAVSGLSYLLTLLVVAFIYFAHFLLTSDY